jgi:type VI secretion system protein ImpA
LEKAAQGKAEQVIGGVPAAEEPPDWNVVVSLALGLLQRTKDLRVACHLAIGLLNRDGAGAFAEALHLIRALLDAQWATVHPLLDPEDDPSLPSGRVTALAGLTLPPVIVALRRSALIVSRGLGPLSLEDLAPTEGQPDAARVAGIFTESALAELEGCLAMLTGALSDLAEIERVFQAHVGDAGPDQSALVRYFQQAKQAVAPRVEARRAAEQPAAGVDGEGAAAAAPRARGLSGDILSREDVVRALDKVSSYFEKNEPSSPIPLLVERCKRLVTMNFLEILGDLAPDAVKQAHVAVGKRDGK